MAGRPRHLAGFLGCRCSVQTYRRWPLSRQRLSNQAGLIPSAFSAGAPTLAASRQRLSNRENAKEFWGRRVLATPHCRNVWEAHRSLCGSQDHITCGSQFTVHSATRTRQSAGVWPQKWPLYYKAVHSGVVKDSPGRPVKLVLSQTRDRPAGN